MNLRWQYLGVEARRRIAQSHSRRTDREGGGARPRVGLSQLALGPGSKMVDATSDPKEQENRQLWIAL
jgi:hypothetical protein